MDEWKSAMFNRWHKNKLENGFRGRPISVVVNNAVPDLTLVRGVLVSIRQPGTPDDDDANSTRNRRSAEVEGQLLSSLALPFDFLLSLTLSLSFSPSFSRILARRRTRSRKDQRSRGSRLLHHASIVSTVPERSGVDHWQPGPAEEVPYRLRRRQATGNRAARMGRLSGQISG